MPTLKKLTLLISSFFILSFALMPAIAGAVDPCDRDGDGTVTTQEAIQCGTDNAAGVPGTTQAPGRTINDTIAQVVNLISLVVGVVAVIMVMVGGVRFMSSGGKEESVKGAKNTVAYALVGAVLVAVAQIIVHFVLYRVTQATT